MNNSHRFENLTWPEVNEAVEKGLIPILPVGTVEQHGPHLPIKMDLWTADSVANEAARRRPDRLVAMPVIPYGFTTHVMDFPGSVTVHHETFIRYVVDVLKSVVYHGFKKVIVVNGHGSNVPPLDLATRRVILETDAIVSLTSWWSLVSTDPDFTSKWRESEFPGGCAHACEVETSLALGIDESMVRKDLVESHRTWTTAQESKFESVDLFGFGPVAVTNWTSTYTETGVCGSAGLATVEKGEDAVRGGGDAADGVGRRVPRPPIPRPQGPPQQAADYGCAGVGRYVWGREAQVCLKSAKSKLGPTPRFFDPKAGAMFGREH